MSQAAMLEYSQPSDAHASGIRPKFVAPVEETSADLRVLPLAPRATIRPTSRGKIIGVSERVRTVISTVERVAASSCTVLVTGESGTGKELVVAALHDASTRANGPLVAVNCGAIAETLIEAELFGHAKGAFTGAHAARQGKVAIAEGGTLFLDEIGELSLNVQVKILRLLQQREYSVVGDARVQKSNIRIVAATNRDLQAEVAAGRFREDLYYRLNVIHVHLPPLRERSEDVALLARHFLDVHRDRCLRPEITGFTPDAMAALVAYEWPGNIRALENTIERAVLLARGTGIDLADLPAPIRGAFDKAPAAPADARSAILPDAGIDMRRAVDEYENNLIRQALVRSANNKAKAAQLLGVNRTTLVEMIKRKGL